MYFFPLIQQSAPHIYHSALPLSPTSSSLRPMILQEKTTISEFYGCPDAWGSVIRTIKPNSGSFTHVITFGQWIAAAIGDETVVVYDSVTGALKLHLSPGGRIEAIRGSPDGSTLFCAHKWTSITGWDIQTGGVIHTFFTQSQVQDIAICSKSCYLACGLYDGSVKIWGVASRSAAATFGSGMRVTHLCWLEPGKQLVVARGTSAQVWDVAAGRVLRSFTMDDRICGVEYAQRLDRFAIVTTSEAKSTITVVDPHTGTSFTHRISQRVSSLALFPITNEFVFSIGTRGVGLFSVPARSWRQFDHLSAITSVSTLLNGTVVANVEGSGIQLLSLDEGHSPPRQPTASSYTVNTLDEGKIIVLHPSNRDPIVLLETATMSEIRTIPTWPSPFRSNVSKILCASLKHHIVVHYVGDVLSGRLRLWCFRDETPSWIDKEPVKRSVGGISPSGSRLVAIDDNSTFSRVRVWDTGNGTRVVDIPIGQPWLAHPLEIRFESEDKFYYHHDTFRTTFTISDSSIIRHEQLPRAEQSKRPYDVGGSREWIVGLSKRVCWIPPEYISSFEPSHCWLGNTLIMAGRDRVLRKLTFREPS